MSGQIRQANETCGSEFMDPQAARELTDQVRTGLEGVFHLIKAAYRGRAWAVLGYGSWDEYVQREFGNLYLRPPLEERTDVVQSLRDAGMSLRSIASATQLSKNTVHRELNEPGVPFGTPEKSTDGPASRAHEAVDTQESNPEGEARVLGQDGRSYAAHRPREESTPQSLANVPEESVPGELPGQLSVDDVLDLPASDVGVEPLNLGERAEQAREHVVRALRDFHGSGSAALPMTIKLASKVAGLVSPVTGSAEVPVERLEELVFDVSRGVRTLSHVIRELSSALPGEKDVEVRANLRDSMDDLDRVLDALEVSK